MLTILNDQKLDNASLKSKISAHLQVLENEINHRQERLSRVKDFHCLILDLEHWIMRAQGKVRAEVKVADLGNNSSRIQNEVSIVIKYITLKSTLVQYK